MVVVSSSSRVDIYTDGACKGNPGPGGWGALLRYDEVETEIHGFDPATTNNRMELMGAIEALTTLHSTPHNVHIHTDSKYVKDGITLWVINWKKRGWKTATGDAVKNQDLWEALDAICALVKPTWHWVKGHDGHPDNERADLLAKLGLQRGIIEGIPAPVRFDAPSPTLSV